MRKKDKKKKGSRIKARPFCLLLLAVFGFLAFYSRPSIDIRGVYTDKNEVALYIMEYNQLPKNYITKADRESAYAVDIKDKVIGGDTYWGKDGITVKVGEETEILHLKNLKECDVKTNSYDIYESRGKERLVYTTNTKEVRIFYTVDHYDTFTEITPEDIAFERVMSKREAEVEGIPYVERSDALLETTALQRKVTEALFEHNTLLFHGSVVAVDGIAYLFTAKSGTGKSTHTRLWRELLGERAVMVNDDKPFLTVTDEGVIVHGSPWNGKHKLGENISLPLRAICILERGEQNKIVSISSSDAINMLIQQSSRPKNSALMLKYLDLIDGVARNVRFYRLSCNMELEAAAVSFGEMSKCE